MRNCEDDDDMTTEWNLEQNDEDEFLWYEEAFKSNAKLPNVKSIIKTAIITTTKCTSACWLVF